MRKQRHLFSPELKAQVACLVFDKSYSHIQASRSVGLVESVLRRWVQQLQPERQGIILSPPVAGNSLQPLFTQPASRPASDSRLHRLRCGPCWALQLGGIYARHAKTLASRFVPSRSGFALSFSAQEAWSRASASACTRPRLAEY